MAIGGVVIQFLVDSGKAVRDMGNLTRSLDKVDTAAATVDTSVGDAGRAIDQTGDFARTADRNLDTAERSFDDLGIASGQAATDLKADVARMADAIRSESGHIDTETGHITTNMRDAGREAGTEFVGNIAEGIGSGTANIQDVMTGTLGGLTNLAATLGGPVGTAAGVAAGAIGFVFAATRKEAERSQEYLNNLESELEGIRDLASETAQQKIMAAWIASFDEVPGRLSLIRDGLTELGISSDVWAKAIGGDAAAQQIVNDKIAAAEGLIEGNRDAQGRLNADQSLSLTTYGMINGELDKTNGKLGGIKSEQDDILWFTKGTAASADEYARNIKEGDENTKGAAGSAKDLQSNMAGARTEAQRIQDVMDALDGKDVRVDFVANYTGRESDWNPAARVGGRTVSVPAPAAATRAAPVTHVTVNVQGVADPYTAARLVETQARKWAAVQGRPGRGRAVAW